MNEKIIENQNVQSWPELMTLEQVKKYFSLSESAVYRIQGFPKPLKIGTANRWRLSDLRVYIEQRAAERDKD